MKKTNEIVQKIESQYVLDDCIQIMIPYSNAMTIVSSDGILFHDKKNSELHINKYLEDERRTYFPYSHIPTHCEKNGKEKIMKVNQILEFNKPYIGVGDDLILERFVLKEKNQALLYKGLIFPTNEETHYMTYDRLVEFIARSKTSENETYYLYQDGSIIEPGKIPYYPTEEEIYEYIKQDLNKNIKDFEEYQKDYAGSTVSQYLKKNPWFLEYARQSIDRLDLSLMDFNLVVGDGSLLIVNINNKNVSIKRVDVKFIRQDVFEVKIYDIPISKFTFDQLKLLPNIKATKEPKIPLSLNTDITKGQIKEARKMVKSLKNNKNLK